MLKDRITEIIKELKMKQKDFGQSIGVTENYISQITSGRKDSISESLALLIERTYHYSSKWIMTGEGEPKEIKKKNTYARMKAQHLIDKLGEKELYAVAAFINSLEDVKKIFSEIYNGHDETVCTAVAESCAKEYNLYYTAPILGKVAGGSPILAIQEYGKQVQTPQKCDCVLELVGDSMSPDFNDGDMLMVVRHVDICNGDLAIVMVMQGAEIAEVTFKRIFMDGDKTILKPINESYKDQELCKADTVVYGKVIGKV